MSKTLSNPIPVKRGRRCIQGEPGIMVGARVTPAQRDALQAEAQRRGVKLADIARERLTAEIVE